MTQDITEQKSDDVPMTVGAILKKARLEKGYTIEDIFKHLKMRPRIVTALEESVFNDLPDEVSTAGFVRSYAAFLKLDSVALAKQVKTEMVKKPLTHLHISYPTKQRSALRPAWWLVLIVVLIAVAALSIGRYSKFNHASQIIAAETQMADAGRADENIVSNTESQVEQNSQQSVQADGRTDGQNDLNQSESIEIKPNITGGDGMGLAESEVDSDSLKPATAPVTESVDVKKMVSIEGQRWGSKTDTPVALKSESGESWVEVTDSKGQVVFAHLMRKGDVYFVPAEKGLKAKFGHAAVMDIYIDGIKQNRFKKSDIVMKNVSLDGR